MVSFGLAAMGRDGPGSLPLASNRPWLRRAEQLEIEGLSPAQQVVWARFPAPSRTASATEPRSASDDSVGLHVRTPDDLRREIHIR